jgi:uncharacterized protein
VRHVHDNVSQAARERSCHHLEHGADPDVRGINDWTPLHMAVSQDSAAAVRLLLAHGADPRLRTRIDDYDTAREYADTLGLHDLSRLLAAAEAR